MSSTEELGSDLNDKLTISNGNAPTTPESSDGHNSPESVDGDKSVDDPADFKLDNMRVYFESW
jgi:hypothetical protein